ncbi:MAG: hypothetical protein OXE97_09050, partial [Gammaproteobacteria bacterium]|nr:hypothetical protein [Gammaproteobacteria bacterium]
MTENSKSELLEIYKLHAELADRVSQRREAANRLHIGILSGLGLAASIFIEAGITESVNFVFLAVGILGSVISASWWVVIRSYRQLNAGKFKALDELENEIAFP